MSKRIIVKNNDGSVSVIIPTGEIPIEEVFRKDVPKEAEAEIVDADKIPADRTFRNGWKYDKTKKIGFDIAKCKDIAHSRRRKARDKEFAPLDEIIAKQIPGADTAAAESARASIRAKYDNIQVSIDNCKNEVELKAIIDAEGL